MFLNSASNESSASWLVVKNEAAVMLIGVTMTAALKVMVPITNGSSYS